MQLVLPLAANVFDLNSTPNAFDISCNSGRLMLFVMSSSSQTYLISFFRDGVKTS